MVALGEQRPAPSEVAVEAAGEPHVQDLHAARERTAVIGLADQTEGMEVLALQAELDQAEAEALAAGLDAPAHDAEGAAVAERADHGPESDGDMGDVVTRDGAAGAMRHAGARRPRPTRAGASPAPRARPERQLRPGAPSSPRHPA